MDEIHNFIHKTDIVDQVGQSVQKQLDIVKESVRKQLVQVKL